jgi:deoxyribose-phosphate aldolase
MILKFKIYCFDMEGFYEYHRLYALITGNEVEEMIAHALERGDKGICLSPFWVKKARRDIGKTGLDLATVIGYPLGYQRSEAKAAEVELALKDGANDLEITLNLSAMKHNQPFWAQVELVRLGKMIHNEECFMTVTIDMEQLTEAECIKACKLSVAAGCDYIKNATRPELPFEKAVEQVALLKAYTPDTVGIKAFGAIETGAQAEALLKAGAEIICYHTPAFHPGR